VPKGKILIVDDSRLSRTFCTDLLQEEGYDVETAETGLSALDMIRGKDFDLVILDLVLPDVSGREVLKRSRQMKASTGFIVVTGYASLDSAIDCLKSGASDYLTKPLNPEEFKIIVNRNIDHRRLFEENAGLRRLLSLYEAGRVISSCIDYERFYEAVLDSFLQIVEGKIGLSIFSEEAPTLQLMAFRGASEEGAKTLTDALVSYLQKNVLTEALCIDSDALGLVSPAVGQFLLAPIKKMGKVAGYVVIFNHPDGVYSDLDVENARFISEHASLSLENVHLYRRARELTYIDDLTKLHNIRYMDMVLENEIKRARRFKSHLSLLFMDIDYFKNINDAYGHRIGNTVLFELGQLLKEIVREIDTVIRYGGDEFTVLLVETSSDGALAIAERIRKTVEEHTFLLSEGLSVRFTITIGVATYPEHATEKEKLLDLADSAMYRGKKGTRNVVVLA
jgi:diguanylate cyclase (GGDEF)-like protein